MGNLHRAMAYLDAIPPALSGSGGHNAALRAACECVRFGLTDGEMLEAMQHYNTRCQPPWSQKELAHKIDSAKAKAQHGARAGHVRAKRTIKPITAAELAELSRQRRRANLVTVTGVDAEPPLPAGRWLGDFTDFMADCYPGVFRVQMIELWQRYSAWCVQHDYAPMVAADFCEWLKMTHTTTKDAAARFWVTPVSADPWGDAIDAAFDRMRAGIETEGQRDAERELRARLGH